MTKERQCNCNCTTSEYSDHALTCPFYLVGKAARLAIEVRPSNEEVKPLWIPTLQVERMIRECRKSKFDTVGVDRKTLEGLLYDSLLWRQERAAQQIKPVETNGLREKYNRRGDAIRELRETLAALWREVCEAGLGEAKDYRWPSVREMTLKALRVQPEEPMPDRCVLTDGVIHCRCGNPSSHYGTMGVRGAHEVRESPEKASDDYGCTGCRSTPCICDQLNAEG